MNMCCLASLRILPHIPTALPAGDPFGRDAAHAQWKSVCGQQELLQRDEKQFVRWYSTTFGTAAVTGLPAASVAAAPAAQPAAATSAAAALQQPLAGGWPACWEAARVPRLVRRRRGRAICLLWGPMSCLALPPAHLFAHARQRQRHRLGACSPAH